MRGRGGARHEVSVILPCRNEEEGLAKSLRELKEVIRRSKIDVEIIVSDSSSDRSSQVAAFERVRLVKHDLEGYGVAIMRGVEASDSKYLVIADSDATYDFRQLPEFVGHLRGGFDFVIGDRFGGAMEPQSMPYLHRYLGNPVLSGLLNLLFSSDIRDSHCGFRGLTRKAYDSMNLRTLGMEFASEMVIQAVKKGLKIRQIPVDYRKRVGKSKMSPFRDGWRHLRFMLLYSPLHLFISPGIALFALGALSFAVANIKPFDGSHTTFWAYLLFSACMMILTGYQLLVFGLFAKTYAITHLGENDRSLDRIHRLLTIERAGLLSFAIIVPSLAASVYLAVNIVGDTPPEGMVAAFMITFTLFSLGIQTLFSTFMLSILGIKEK